MLTRLGLRNFKCFQSVEINPCRITVLIGPNGSGKSSMIQSLMLMRQSSAGAALTFRGPFIDLVNFQETVRGKVMSRSIGLSYSGTRNVGGKPAIFTYDTDLRSTVGEGVVARDDQGWPITNRATLKWLDVAIETETNAEGQESPIRPLSIEGKSWEVGPGHGLQYPIVSKYRSRSPEMAAGRDVVSALIGVWAAEIAGWRFVPALRGFDKPSYLLAAESIDEIKPTEDPEDIAAKVATTLGYDESTEATVARWVRQTTGAEIDYRIEPGPRVSARSRSSDGSVPIPIVNEGFGTNQLVYLMFQLAKTPAEGVAAIEEAETHLHPAAVAKLGDVFVEAAISRNIQLVLTTHSEHLLMSLLNNVAERKLEVDDLAIYYFERTNESPLVSQLEITSDGMVNGGLPGFFDATLAAQRRRLDALTGDRS